MFGIWCLIIRWLSWTLARICLIEWRFTPVVTVSFALFLIVAGLFHSNFSISLSINSLESEKTETQPDLHEKMKGYTF